MFTYKLEKIFYEKGPISLTKTGIHTEVVNEDAILRKINFDVIINCSYYTQYNLLTFGKPIYNMYQYGGWSIGDTNQDMNIKKQIKYLLSFIRKYDPKVILIDGYTTPIDGLDHTHIEDILNTSFKKIYECQMNFNYKTFLLGKKDPNNPISILYPDIEEHIKTFLMI